MTQPTKREQLAAMRLEDFKAHLRSGVGRTARPCALGLGLDRLGAGQEHAVPRRATGRPGFASGVHLNSPKMGD